MFQIKGNIITIDAMGTQKEIAQMIIEREADYVLAIKGNERLLYEDIEFHLDSEIKDKGKTAIHHFSGVHISHAVRAKQKRSVSFIFTFLLKALDVRQTHPATPAGCIF